MPGGDANDVDSEFLAFLTDELTMLACLRQGIDAATLLPLQSVGATADPSHEKVRWEQLEARRRNRIQVARKERAALVAHILHLNATGEEDMQLEMELWLRCSQILGVPSAELTEAHVASGFGAFMDEGEELATQEVIRRSIRMRDAKLKKICNVSLRDNSAGEVEKFVDRELRQVNKEKQLADESDQLRERSKMRDAKLKEAERQLKAELKAAGEERSRQRLLKIERMKAANEDADRVKQERLAELARLRSERGERKLAEKLQENDRLADRRQQKTELVKERQGLVAFSLDQNTKLASDKLECKLDLHEQRCVNQDLKKACEKEVRRIRRLQHQVSVSRFKKQQQQEHDEKQLVVFEKLAAHSERHAREKRKVFKKLKDQRERENELQFQAAERRNLLELQRVQGVNSILMQTLEKERYLEGVQNQKEAVGAARVEMNQQKQLCMNDNKTRIERMRNYKMVLSSEKVKHDILREKKRKETQGETFRLFEERARHIRVKKERMREELRSGKAAARIASAPAQRAIADAARPDDFDDTGSQGSAVYSIDDLSPLEDMYLIDTPRRPSSGPFKYADATDDYADGQKTWSPKVEFPQYCRPQQRRPIYSAPVVLRR
eukprot:TRINITY_DN18302_c0_g1_i1.p1 TRINITY_DN18302_c0_g1~~TRINITY_DN18302_c0_g1_i1.p1  ORF type:complete len:613 (+),score=246.44 TRINITY_DN18302_c0_g1_i1:97-1935(+)